MKSKEFITESAERLNDDYYWSMVSDELSDLSGKDVSLTHFEMRSEGRVIKFDMEGQEIELVQSWRRDGSPSKPVTYLNDVSLGRFAIWDDPEETAEDILNNLS